MKLTEEEKDYLYKIVYNYPAIFEEGLIDIEVKNLINDIRVKIFPNKVFNKEAFDSAMMGNTCMVKNEMIINYHCDVFKGVLCALENRGLTIEEWD